MSRCSCPSAGARAAFDELVAAADGWGAPDPVRAAMTEWRFDEAEALIGGRAGLAGRRDELLDRDGARRPVGAPND